MTINAMKTIRRQLATALCLALLLPALAQAYFSPERGRWINRDPIQEKGSFPSRISAVRAPVARDNGCNLYSFTRNSPISHRDALGLATITDDYCCRKEPVQLIIPTSPAHCCCTGDKVADSLKVLTDRWLSATKYLTDNQAEADPDDESGVSCVQSANKILAFMSPIPPCWKCYIHRRSWKWTITDDQNSIVCERCTVYGYCSKAVVFDWWYQKLEHFPYAPIAWDKYQFEFGYDLDPPLYGAWTAGNPAPHDDCGSKNSLTPTSVRLKTPVNRADCEGQA